MKPSEIRQLNREHPELVQLAIGMERNAQGYNKATKGLGRRWSWESLIAADEAQYGLFPDPAEINCMCFDGEDAAA